MRNFSCFAPLRTSLSSVFLRSLPASLTFFFFSVISKKSCLYRAKDVFPLKASSLLRPTLTASHLTALLRSLSSLLAHDDVQLAPVTAPSLSEAPLSLDSLDQIHTLVPSSLQLSPFLPSSLSAHIKSQYLHRKPELPPTAPFASTASDTLRRAGHLTLPPQHSRLAFLQKVRTEPIQALNSQTIALASSKNALKEETAACRVMMSAVGALEKRS